LIYLGLVLKYYTLLNGLGFGQKTHHQNGSHSESFFV